MHLEFQEIFVNFICEILVLMNIKVENEEIILNIIKTRLEKMNDKKEIKENKFKKKKERKERKELIECINSEYLTRKSLKEYINMIEEEDMKGDLWNEFKKVFINNLDKMEENQNEIRKMKEDKRKEEEERKKWKQHCFNGNDYFNGIIKYLERKYGQDIHKRGIITITASSSSYNNPEDVINYKWNRKEYWYSNFQNPGEWWQINFKKMKVN